MRTVAATLGMVMAILIGGSGAGLAQGDPDLVDIPGGGTVATPDAFTWARPILLLDPSDFVLFLRGRKTNIGGNKTFRAALAVGNMSEVSEPFLPRVAGKLPDADWTTATHHQPAWDQPGASDWSPLSVEGADEARMFRLNVKHSPLFGAPRIDGFVAEAAAGDRRAAVFGHLRDYDERAAAALLADALRDAP